MQHVLAIFDVDGTLVDLAGAGARAMGRAFSEVFGIDDALLGLSFAGRTDRAIVRSVLEAAGQVGASGGATDEDIARILDVYLALLPEEIERTPYSPIRGARRLLETLRGLSQVRIGVATGNVRRGSELKLRSAGIDVELDFGAYGGEVEERSELVRRAVERGLATLPADATSAAWVLGDTPHDVRAARAVGARALAVAGGPFSTRELEATGADLVVADLEEALEKRFWSSGSDA